MKPEEASPDELTITTEDVKVSVKEGKNPWPIIIVAIASVIILTILALNVIHVQQLTEETYYENETIVQNIPASKEMITQKTTEKNETYTIQETYIPTRNFTRIECTKQPLSFSYNFTNEITENKWDYTTNTGYDSNRNMYVKRLTVCNNEMRVTSDELFKDQNTNRDITLLYSTCNKAPNMVSSCSDLKITIKPEICTSREQSWSTQFSEDKDIVLTAISTISTKEVCALTTREIPLDEFEKHLGGWQPTKNYTATRNTTRIRTILEYVNETTQQDTAKPETIIREVPKTRTVVKRITLWQSIFS